MIILQRVGIICVQPSEHQYFFKGDLNENHERKGQAHKGFSTSLMFSDKTESLLQCVGRADDGFVTSL